LLKKKSRDLLPDEKLKDWIISYNNFYYNNIASSCEFFTNQGYDQGKYVQG